MPRDRVLWTDEEYRIIVDGEDGQYFVEQLGAGGWTTMLKEPREVVLFRAIESLSLGGRLPCGCSHRYTDGGCDCLQ